MEERHGLLFADVSGTAGPLDDHLGDLTQHLEHYRLGELERCGAITYDVESNWKAIVENYSECLHCPGVHPELNRLSHYMSGDEYEGAGAWCGGSMTLNEGAETMAQNGGHAHRPAIKGLSDKEQRDVLYFALFPNLLVSLHPDYVMVHTLWPRGAGRTEVVCEWYFEPETAARPGLRSVRRDRASGTWSTARTGRCASSSSAASARAGTSPGATPTTRSPSTPSTSSWPTRTSTR